MPSDLAERTPRLTVVVATRNRPRLLRDALASLNDVLRAGDHVIVVDSASNEADAVSPADEMGAATLRCELPGACRARNTGTEAAPTDLVAFMDDDCLPAPGWLDALSKAFSDAPGTQFVTGRILPEGGSSGRAQLGISLCVSEDPRTFGEGDDPSAMGHGANMAWRRDALLSLGGFDELMGPGARFRAAEDHDVFWRALRAGYTGAYVPTAVIKHRQWRNRRQQLRAYYAYGVGTGAFEVKRSRLDGRDSRATNAAPRALSARSATARLAVTRARSLATNVVRGYQMGAAGDAFMLAGAVTGAAGAARVPVVDGHFSSRV
ncbi:MAG: glycosyltransferase family 2 protein [Acidimicrobiales bacterium]